MVAFSCKSAPDLFSLYTGLWGFLIFSISACGIFFSTTVGEHATVPVAGLSYFVLHTQWVKNYIYIYSMGIPGSYFLTWALYTPYIYLHFRILKFPLIFWPDKNRTAWIMKIQAIWRKTGWTRFVVSVGNAKGWVVGLLVCRKAVPKWLHLHLSRDRQVTLHESCRPVTKVTISTMQYSIMSTPD